MSDEGDSFIVFGCGLPRTGTYSVSKALEQLLGGKCLHGYSIILEKNPEHLKFWTQYTRNKTRDLSVLRNFLVSHGYTAGVDVPIMYLYKEMLQAFPNAKVLLTVREPKSWYKSYIHFVRRLVRGRNSLPVLLMEKINGTGLFGETIQENFVELMAAAEKGEEEAIAYFHDWNERIRKEVPAERLLVYDVRDGWEPLCKFLGVTVPDCPFPHLNSSASVVEFVREIARPANRVAWVFLCVAVAVLSYFMHGLLTSKYEGQSYASTMWIVAILFGIVLLLLFTLKKISEFVEQFTLS